MSILLESPGEEEMAAIFRRIEKTARAEPTVLAESSRRGSFDAIDANLSSAKAVEEARRCLSCGCRKADGCRLRRYGTDHGVDPYRFRGERRKFSQDLSHPQVIYEPGKCILCDACVRIAEAAGEEFGLTAVGRGFQVTVGVPFGRELVDGLRTVAAQCADACPTGALALRTERSCDICGLCAYASLRSEDTPTNRP